MHALKCESFIARLSLRNVCYSVIFKVFSSTLAVDLRIRQEKYRNNETIKKRTEHLHIVYTN